MAHKQTVALIGAASTTGKAIAAHLAAMYRLLLMDAGTNDLEALQNAIAAANNQADTEVVTCCKDASWEADIIVVANDGEGIQELAETMKEVATCKPVIHFTTNDNLLAYLQPLLPYAGVVAVLLSQPFNMAHTSGGALIHGNDAEALSIAKEMLIAIGCLPQDSATPRTATD